MHHMRQLMRHQLLPMPTPGGVSAVPKEQIISGGERLRLQRTIQQVRLGIGMNPDIAEIRPKGLLQAAAERTGKRLAAALRAVDGSFDIWRSGDAAAP